MAARRRRRRAGRPLTGRVVAITGGGRGIGKALAQSLAHRGCSVAIGDLDADLARETATELGPEVIGFGLNVCDRESFEHFLAQVEERLGPVDVLVNNAGIMLLGDFAGEADDATDAMLDVNVRGVALGSKLAIKRMRQRGSGHIVNIASQAGKVGFPGAVTYATSKHAVVGMSESLRFELRDTGISVSCVMPAVVNTQLGSHLARTRLVPQLEPDDVAEAIVEALETERFEVWVPRYSRALVVGSQLLPRSVSDWIGRVIGVDRVLAQADHGARSQYSERARQAGTGGSERTGDRTPS